MERRETASQCPLQATYFAASNQAGLWEESVETVRNMRDDAKQPDLAARMVASSRKNGEPFLLLAQPKDSGISA